MIKKILKNIKGKVLANICIVTIISLFVAWLLPILGLSHLAPYVAFIIDTIVTSGVIATLIGVYNICSEVEEPLKEDFDNDFGNTIEYQNYILECEKEIIEARDNEIELKIGGSM